MKKRIISAILALCMLFGLSAAALAAQPDAGDAAQTLYELGLFRGVGTREDGSPEFDLDRTPNRAEALTMLVRLLGKETEAQEGTWEIPFTDVPNWAKPYVGYAYAAGLTNGTGATTFSSDSPVSATQYLTFVLRALGYSSDSDFRWNAAWEKSDELGITHGEYGPENNQVSRGDMAVLSAETLGAALKDTDTPLIQALVESGAVEAQAALAQGYILKTEDEADLTVTRGEKGLIIEVSSQAGLTQALDQAEKVEEIRIGKDFTVTENSMVYLGPERVDRYKYVKVTIPEGVTLTVGEGGVIGAAWFTYEGDWDNAPEVIHRNYGTVVVEKGGCAEGDFGDNYGTILVKDGGECVCVDNYGTVIVEAGGLCRTSQGDVAENEGEILIRAGGELRSRFGSTIANRGTLTVEGAFYCGCVTWAEERGEAGEGAGELFTQMWFENSGAVTGSGSVFVYDAAAWDVAEYPDTNFRLTDMEEMVRWMRDRLGDGTSLTVGISED